MGNIVKAAPDYSYLTLLIVIGTAFLMYANRKVKLPATRYFKLALAIIFIMAAAAWGENYTILYFNRLVSLGRTPTGRELKTLIAFRTAFSVVNYVLYPVIIMLELALIVPNRRRAALYWLPAVLNALLYFAVPITGRLTFYYSSSFHFNRGPLGTTVFFVIGLYLVLLLIYSFRMIKEKEKRSGIIVLLIASMSAFTILLEAFNIVSGAGVAVAALGIMLYYSHLLQLHRIDTDRELSEQKERSAQDRIKLLQEQIHPHFIFNSLFVIKALIRHEPKKAADALDAFSDYLRSHIDVIRSDIPISFSDELEHVKAYLALETADPSRTIEVEYDIAETDFRLPALSVQPIVENAVRHGLGRNGGHILIRTAKTEDGFSVTVEDDGSNSGSTEIENNRSGIAVKNVSTRLSMLCGGMLETETKDLGTKVTLFIPAQICSRDE